MIAFEDPGLPVKLRITLDQTQHRVAGMLIEHEDIAGAEVHQILDADPSCAELDGHGDITFLE